LARRGATAEQVRRQLPKAREHLAQAKQYLKIANAELTSR
jgi:hypothetical protein